MQSWLEIDHNRFHNLPLNIVEQDKGTHQNRFQIKPFFRLHHNKQKQMVYSQHLTWLHQYHLLDRLHGPIQLMNKDLARFV